MSHSRSHSRMSHSRPLPNEPLPGSATPGEWGHFRKSRFPLPGSAPWGGPLHFPIPDRLWPQVPTWHVFVIRGGKPTRFRKLGGRWKDMPVYLSNGHLITRNTSTPGAPWRNQKRDFQKKRDFKVEPRHIQTNRQRTDRPSQHPSSCGKFISRGRACQPPHSNISRPIDFPSDSFFGTGQSEPLSANMQFSGG